MELTPWNGGKTVGEPGNTEITDSVGGSSFGTSQRGWIGGLNKTAESIVRGLAADKRALHKQEYRVRKVSVHRFAQLPRKLPFLSRVSS
jgi:hypothetical protein